MTIHRYYKAMTSLQSQRIGQYWLRLCYAAWLCLPLLTQAAVATQQTDQQNELQIDQQIAHRVTDWVDDPNYPSACYGYYAMPDLAPISDAIDLNTQAIELISDQAELHPQGLSTFSGNVAIKQKGRQLFADTATLYRNATTNQIEQIDAFGQVLVEQANARLAGRAAHLDNSKQTLAIEHSDFRFYPAHARGTAESFYYQKDQPYRLEQVHYTTCPPADSTWSIAAKTVALNKQSGRGYATNAWLNIKDIPILYTPYISFPISNQRLSGFLAPRFSTSNSRGNEFTLPYYFNLAPNYDATITPSWSSKRGLHVANEFRLKTSHLDTEAHINVSPHDNAYADFENDVIENNPNNYAAGDPRINAVKDGSATRAYFALRSQATFDPNWRVNATIQRVTDDNYFVDLGQPLFEGDSRLLMSNLGVTYQDEHWTVLSEAQDYQTLQPYEGLIYLEPYFTLPRVQAFADYPDLFRHIELFFSGEIVHFMHDDDVITGESFTKGVRIDATPVISMPWRTPFAYITPRVELRNTLYNLNLGHSATLNNKPSTLSRSIPLFSLDSAITLERENPFGQTDLIQTLEPRLYYLYVPYRNQNDFPVFDSGHFTPTFDQLFRANRFTSRDRIGDANQVTLAVTSRLFNVHNGQEKARLNAGQIVYFSNRRITLCDTEINPACIDSEDPEAQEKHSDLFADLSYALNSAWDLSGDARWDNASQTIRQYGAQLRYHPNAALYATVGYRSDKALAQNSAQLTTSLAWDINPRWHILANWQHDFVTDIDIDRFVGLEYESCCFAARLGTRRYLLSDNQIGKQFENVIFLQLILKGLLSFGEDFASFAESKIAGYKDILGTHY